VQYHGRARMKFLIPKGAFRPVPRVDSACLHLEIAQEPTVAVSDPELFASVVKAAFGQRRKTLRNSLTALAPEAEEALALAGIDPGLRAETLSIGEFARIADSLAGLTAK